MLDILFLSNHNIHKSLYGLWLEDFSKIYWWKGLKPKKQIPYKLLWMLWFDEKSLSNIHKQLRIKYVHERRNHLSNVLKRNFPSVFVKLNFSWPWTLRKKRKIYLSSSHYILLYSLRVSLEKSRFKVI